MKECHIQSEYDVQIALSCAELLIVFEWQLYTKVRKIVLK